MENKVELERQCTLKAYIHRLIFSDRENISIVPLEIFVE